MVHIVGKKIHYSKDVNNSDYISHRELYALELKRLRTNQGLTKTRFALMIGISRRYLIKLESADASPTLEMMERIAAGLGVTVQDMVDFERIERRESASSDRSIRGRS